MCSLNVLIDTNSLTVSPEKKFFSGLFFQIQNCMFSFSVYHIQDQESQVQMAAEVFSNTDSLGFSQT